MFSKWFSILPISQNRTLMSDALFEILILHNFQEQCTKHALDSLELHNLIYLGKEDFEDMFRDSISFSVPL